MRHDDEEAAERFARALLIPADTFDARLRRTDVDLVERFIDPLDHVGARRPRARARADAWPLIRAIPQC